LFGSETELLSAVEHRTEELGEFFFAFEKTAGDRRRADAHALPAHALDEAFDLEPRVRFADGHGVDLRGLGDLPNAGEEIAGAEFAAGDQGADLIDELAVDGDSRGGVELEESRREGHGVLL
jgi:hypothetical protein